MNENKIRDYKDLKVWQMALGVACDIIELVEMLPSGYARDVISRQMIDSSTSVCANIAEGHSSGSRREFSRILRIAFREAKETDNWLNIIKCSKKTATSQIIDRADKIIEKNIIVLKMLSSLQARVKEGIEKQKLSKN